MNDYIELQVNSRLHYEGMFFRLYRDEVLLPDGNRASREFISYPGAVIVVPQFENGDTLLIHQFRYAVNDHLWEFPAGKMEDGEDKTLSAGRELVEESGYRADTLTHITDYYPSPGYSSERMHLFLAEGLSNEGQDLDKDEFIEVKRIPFKEVIEMIQNGEIKDMKTIAAVFLVQNIWNQT